MSKRKLKNPSLLYVVVALVSLFVIMIVFERSRNSELERHAFENVAIVKSKQFISYRVNDKSSDRVELYRIELQYEYQGEHYLKILDVDMGEYDRSIGKFIKEGDELEIVHSWKDPLNVKLK